MQTMTSNDRSTLRNFAQDFDAGAAVTKSGTGTWDLGLGDSGTWGRGDVGTWGRGDVGTRGRGEVGTRGLRDVGTWGRGDSGTRGCGDAFLPFV